MAAPINPEILVIARMIDEISGTARAISESMKTMGESGKTAAEGIGKVPPKAEETHFSMSRLALSLRMLSISSSIFRREIGGLPPALDAMSRGVMLVATFMTGAVASVQLFTMANRILSGVLGVQLPLSFVAAKTAGVGFFATIDLMLGPVGWAIIAVISLAAAIASIVTYFSPAQQATRAYAAEIDGLNRAIETTKSSIQGLQFAMEALGIQDQMLLVQQIQIEAAIKKRGYATEGEKATLSAIAAHQDEVNISLEDYRLSLMIAQHAQEGFENNLEKINKAISDQPSFGIAPPGSVPWAHELAPTYGQAGFPPAYMAFKAADIRMGGGGAKGVSVNISFPNARFSTDIDLQRALRNAGQEAAIEVKRRL